MQNLVRRAIQDSGFSRAELARRAGVSASTITRIERGDMDPTLGMASRILAAADFQFVPRLEPLCDPRILTSARSVLDDKFPLAADAETSATLKRWSTRDGSPKPRSLAREAGEAAPPLCRPGVTTVRTDWTFLRICSAVAATRKRWAVSGAPAAARIGADGSRGPIVLYVEEPERIRTVIGQPAASAQYVILIPLDGTSEAGAWNDQGIVWADPIQVILDCYGMPETQPQAEQLTADWEESRE